MISIGNHDGAELICLTMPDNVEIFPTKATAKKASVLSVVLINYLLAEIRFMILEGDTMKIRLLTVGKIENESAQALADMYRNRISHYVDFYWETVKPEKSKSFSASEILMREGQRIVQKLDLKDYTILLDKEGRQQSSEEFASSLERLAQGVKQITLLIGGPWGVTETIRKQATELLSLSKMTLPHELAAVVLLEQLYRAFSILKGEKYHK